MDISELRNRVFNEDCLVGMSKIPDKSIDCIICDLPYGTTDCSWDSLIDLESLWGQYKRIRKSNCPIILFGSEPFSSFLRMSNIKEFKYDFVWIKNWAGNFQLAKKNPLKYHEIISVFYSSLPTYHNTELKEVDYHHTQQKRRDHLLVKNWATIPYKTSIGNYNKSVLYYNKTKSNYKSAWFHPTQKPVDLIRYLIRTYTNPGDLILDNCLGSGTTCIAAMREGRDYVGFEMNQEFYEMTLRRIEDEKDYVEKEKKEKKERAAVTADPLY